MGEYVFNEKFWTIIVINLANTTLWSQLMFNNHKQETIPLEESYLLTYILFAKVVKHWDRQPKLMLPVLPQPNVFGLTTGRQ